MNRTVAIGSKMAHLGNHSTGSDTVVETHPSLIVSVLAPAQEVLVTHKVWLLIHHPASTLHLNGVTAAEMRVQVSAVTAALIGTSLEVLVFIKDDL